MKTPIEILDARIDAILERPAMWAPSIQNLELVLYHLLSLRCQLDGSLVDVRALLLMYAHEKGVHGGALGPSGALIERHSNDNVRAPEVLDFYRGFVLRLRTDAALVNRGKPDNGEELVKRGGNLDAHERVGGFTAADIERGLETTKAIERMRTALRDYRPEIADWITSGAAEAAWQGHVAGGGTFSQPRYVAARIESWPWLVRPIDEPPTSIDVGGSVTICGERYGIIAKLPHAIKLTSSEALVFEVPERWLLNFADDAATRAFDELAKLCGCEKWWYPGQIVRDVTSRIGEYDELEARYLALRDAVDQIRSDCQAARSKSLRREPGEDVEIYSTEPEWVLVEDILDTIRHVSRKRGPPSSNDDETRGCGAPGCDGFIHLGGGTAGEHVWCPKAPPHGREAPTGPSPIPMLLHCPECRARHVDQGEFATKVHHTHSCQTCGHTWRPALVATVGVQFLPGFKDPPSAHRDEIPLREQTRCPSCGWRNFLIRKRCRNCNAELVMHPDPKIDAEVRNDYDDGVEAELAATSIRSEPADPNKAED